MKIKGKSIFYLIILSILNFSISFAQNDKLWSEETPNNLLLFQKNAKHLTHKKERICRLNLDLLKQKLKNSHQSLRQKKSRKSELIIPFPNKNGGFTNYTISEAPILSSELQNKYPNIRSYIGISTDSLKTRVRFSVSDIGLNLMKFSKNGNSEFIDPYTKDALTYTIYSKKDLPNDVPKSICNVLEQEKIKLGKKSNKQRRIAANDGIFRKYKLALSCTGEYAQFHLNDQGIDPSATDEVKKAAVLSAMNITMTRVNGIFEKEVALTMELVANNDVLIFLDPNTDGYTSDDDFELIEEVQAKCNNLIGFSNYDVGHLFNIGFSGLASASSQCSSKKAEAVSGRTPAFGDSFDIDFVAHEMGHQFGASHTFNNSCSNNISTSTSVEPGSGSTIMGYAGICAPNVQEHSDAYFHGVSVEQIYSNISGISNDCAERSSIGNSPPTANAGNNYLIPISTPFALTGTGTDDNGSITYCWEQTDTQTATMPPLETNARGPLFRSLPPTASATRHFPMLETTITGATGNVWEQLSSVARDINFKLTVRDNQIPIGQFATDNMKITVVDTTEPFTITSQNTPETFHVGESQTITWNVANTNTSPINTSLVNIRLSKDGGNTFPILLAENIPNNGSHSIITPNETTTTGRIKIEAVGNVYYTINPSNITIDASNFVMNLEESNLSICSPNQAIYRFEYNTFRGFNDETTFSITGIPENSTAVFSPASAINDGTMVTLTISNINSSMQGTYSPILTGTAVSDKINVNLSLAIFNTITMTPALTCPKNNAINIPLSVEFTWLANKNIPTYQIEIATDSNFDDIVETVTVNKNSYISNSLQVESTYYWRVIGENSCGTSGYSFTANFETGTEEEIDFTSNDTPIDIPDNDSNGVSSTINITEAYDITDVDVKVNIEHPYIGDIKLSLVSPELKEIVLVPNSDNDGSNYTNTTFDDSATTSIPQGNAPYSGSFKPEEELANFNRTRTNGNWILKVSDNESEDTGKLVNWTLSFSGIEITDQTCELLSVNIRKAFSPNGDSVNDFWIIDNINTTGFENKTIPTANVRIFNIRGQVVYSSDGYKNDWDGVSSKGKKLPIGTYIYEVTFSLPEYQTQKGWMYIKY